MNIKYYVPPFLLGLILKIVRPVHGFSGNYKSFDHAKKECIGYESCAVIENYKAKLEKEVKTPQPSQIINDRGIRLLNSFLMAANEIGSNKSFKILDFGGAWGNHYFDVFKTIDSQIESYTICESPSVAAELCKINSPLKFISSLEGFEDKNFDICIASCVLPYIEEPFKTLHELNRVSKYIVLDRMPLISDLEKNVITIQKNFSFKRKVTSYPAMFFSQNQFLQELRQIGIEVVFRWKVPEDMPYFKGTRRDYSGMLLRCSS